MISPSSKEILFLPIGGSDEIGMNLNLLGHNGQWLMLDCGVTFFDRLGVEVITPDPTFLEEHSSKIVGLVVTHAHEDHIGAIPYLWPYFKCPIYGTRFTLNVIKGKIKELPWGNQIPIHEVPLSGTVGIGHFNVEFITLTHSIPEPNALAIRTPLGTIVHTGDWKIDPSPFIGKVADKGRLKALGDMGVLALTCDSTNVFCEGETGSEKEVRENLINLIEQYPNNRLTVGCFASNIARIETIALAAQKRKICFLGRSLSRMVESARKSGYLQDIQNIVGLDQALELPPSKILFISTGSQGEFKAALSRISLGQHRVMMDERDIVIFSSRIIPGNEKNIAVIKNRLVRQGVTIITASGEDIHVSGHPSRDELKKMYEWVRPEILVPVHGEALHLYEQSRLGQELGIKKTIVPHNGSLIRLAPGNPEIIETIPVCRWMYDGSRLISSKSSIFKERQKLGTEGVVFVSLFLDSHYNMVDLPKITFHGLLENGETEEDITQICLRIIRNNLSFSIDNVQERIKKEIRQIFSKKIGKKPTVEIHCLVK